MSGMIETPEGMMTHHELARLFGAVRGIGNGSFERGYANLCEVDDRLMHARGKHSWEHYTPLRGALAVRGEAAELEQAVRHEGRERQHSECLDVLAPAFRFLNQEWRRG